MRFSPTSFLLSFQRDEQRRWSRNRVECLRASCSQGRIDVLCHTLSPDLSDESSLSRSSESSFASENASKRGRTDPIHPQDSRWALRRSIKLWGGHSSLEWLSGGRREEGTFESHGLFLCQYQHSTHSVVLPYFDRHNPSKKQSKGLLLADPI